ncbi:hypothetical protein CSC17_4602 [Klebsiella oxytoca]|jgi:hypothetical protein|nr:hypothetical protein CSC17_4602 [Klebsiella oxytoca]
MTTCHNLIAKLNAKASAGEPQSTADILGFQLGKKALKRP